LLYYRAGVEQRLPARFVAQAAYIGGHGRHLLLESVANLITGVDPTSGTVTRQNPRFAEIPLTTSGGDDLYHSLQTRLTRDFTSGFNLTAAWTWAQSRGISADAVQDPRCLMCERSRGNYDVRHTLAADATYSHVGWLLSAMFTARTGLPLNVLIDRPDVVRAIDGTWAMSTPGGGAHRTAQRPDLVGGIDPYIGSGRQWLNPAAFAMPATGLYGNLPRNALNGPGLAQLDAAVVRSVQLAERVTCELRAAVYNVAGRLNYRNPANVLPHAGFGYLGTPILQAGSTRAARDGEVGLRVVF
jgi:hypothetical protein